VVRKEGRSSSFEEEHPKQSEISSRTLSKHPSSTPITPARRSVIAPARSSFLPSQ